MDSPPLASLSAATTPATPGTPGGSEEGEVGRLQAQLEHRRQQVGGCLASKAQYGRFAGCGCYRPAGFAGDCTNLPESTPPL